MLNMEKIVPRRAHAEYNAIGLPLTCEQRVHKSVLVLIGQMSKVLDAPVLVACKHDALSKICLQQLSTLRAQAE